MGGCVRVFHEVCLVDAQCMKIALQRRWESGIKLIVLLGHEHEVIGGDENENEYEAER